MVIHTNKELVQAVNEAIKESGIKKTVLAEKIGLSRQGLDILLKSNLFHLTMQIESLIFTGADDGKIDKLSDFGDRGGKSQNMGAL